MSLFFFKWSKTAASNATADAQVNWQEGQAPSSVNDSGRAMMASLAGYRDDIAGAIVTGGSSTAYTVTSNQIFDSLANMNGALIAFTPHATNGATVTLNVDGLGAKPLRPSPSVELLAGTLILGTPYVATYNNSDAVWYLHNFYGNPYNIPLAGGLDYWGPTAPNTSFAFPIGQAINRTTYATLFAIMGTTHGVGDGSTTFNLPDKRGRVSAAADGGAGILTDAVSGIDSLGDKGGAQTKTLETANLPPYTPAGTNSGGAAAISTSTNQFQFGGTNAITGIAGGAGINASFTNPTFTGTAQGGTSTAFTIVQPTIVCNYILRIL